MKINHIIASTVAVSLLLVAQAQAQLVEFYVGIDARPTLTSGVYLGQPNPNAGRLTFFYGHGYPYVPGSQPAGQSAFNNNHYHGISSYSLTGPTNNPSVMNTNANSRIPERSTGQPPLTLVPTTNALYAGKLVSAKTAEHYSNMRLHSVWKLNDPAIYGPGSPEWVMFHSSGNTRTNSLASSDIALELVGKSEGLNIGSATTLNILSNPGDRFSLGDGNQVDFTPIFWVDGNTPTGSHWVALKLVDTNTAGGRTPLPESGIYWIDFKVAGEPSLAIEKTVTLSVPLVTEGYVLESATSVEGPWTPVTIPGDAHGGNQRTLTLPAAGELQVFRLRKL